MKTQFSVFFLLFCICFGTNAKAQGVTITLDSTILNEREVAVGLQVPWEIVWGPDDFIWATERRGRVLRINPTTGNVQTVLNIENLVESGGEPGLLGMALHPNFAQTPLVYIDYNYALGSAVSEKVVSYQWNGNALVNPVALLDSIPGGGIHNGSRLLITPDGKLLITCGDTGSGVLSQNMNTVAGKLLRMNLDGTIPADNPIPGSLIYSFGHRNSQGLAYGPGGKLYSSEHGAQQDDEFNLIEPNRNYGWPNVQGVCNTNSEINFCNANNVKEPLMAWSPCVAVNGLDYYTHPAIPEWKNKMLMAVLGGFALLPRVSVLSFDSTGTKVVAEKQYFKNYGRIRDLCINPKTGAIYFATNGPSYPGAGPNKIIEYRNLAYQSSAAPVVADAQQFMQVSPVPVSAGQPVRLTFSESFLGVTYQVFSLDSKLITQGTVTGTEMLLETGDLPKAAFYITASNELGVVSKMFVVVD
jgi:aldose sugar dehydrogenase